MRDRRERFISLAEARTGRAIQAIRLIGNLTNKSNYEFREADAQQIIKALDQELRILRTKFAEGANARDTDFRLRSE
jgi:ABC-type Fe3+-hydroxamate transport system substrate-binding protein